MHFNTNDNINKSKNNLPPPPQLGGTVGDIESMPFIEAFRQFQFKVKRENFCNIHVSLVPQVRVCVFFTKSYI